MNEELKLRIVAEAKEYAAAKCLTNNEIAKITNINPGYISNMFRNVFANEVAGKETPIGDKWFYKLADTIGLPLKKQYWQIIQTKEFEQMIHELKCAKDETKVTTIISDTGCGKTFSVQKFCRMHPQHTYKITVSSMYRVTSILNEIAVLLDSPIRFNSLDTLIGISKKLRELKMMGNQPLIIIDEAENLKLPVIQMLKGLYDSINGFASIVLIGTSHLTDALIKMTISNKGGAAQFYSRIKAGIRRITPYNDFNPFFQTFNITDKGLQKLLTSLCNNYRELHDYLEPALREADERNEPLTENFFRLMHNIPKYN